MLVALHLLVVDVLVVAVLASWVQKTRPLVTRVRAHVLLHPRFRVMVGVVVGRPLWSAQLHVQVADVVPSGRLLPRLRVLPVNAFAVLTVRVVERFFLRPTRLSWLVVKLLSASEEKMMRLPLMNRAPVLLVLVLVIAVIALLHQPVQ